MKHFLLAICWLLAATAQAVTISYEWNKPITNAKQTTGYDVVTSADGNYLTVSSIYTVTDLKWGSEDLKLTDDGTTITPANLVFNKIDTKGNILWTVNTSLGGCSYENGCTAVTSDGGYVMAFRVRFNKAGGADKELVHVVDAKGNKSEVAYACPESYNPYVAVLMKLSSDGAVQWIHDVADADYNAPASGSYVVQPIYVNALTVDADDNIYLGGRICSTVSFRASATTWGEKHVAHNVASTWNGGSQTVNGDLFVAKFDKDGWYQKSLTATADAQYASRDQVAQLKYADGAIYWAGQVTGVAATKSYTLGTATISVPNQLDNILVGKLTTDLATQWVSQLEATGYNNGTHTTQLKGLNIGKKGIYLTGLVKGGFAADASSVSTPLFATSSASLEGFVVKYSVDGLYQAGAIHGVGISGYFSAYEDTNSDHMLVYGYNMTTPNNAVFLVDYDSSFKQVEVYKLLVGGMNTAFGSAYNATTGQLISVSRTNAESTIYGTEEKIAKPAAYSGIYSAFSLKDVSTGVADVVAGNGKVSVVAVAGGVEISAAEPTTVNVYSGMGALVKRVSVAADGTTVSLQPGFYIVGQQKVIVR